MCQEAEVARGTPVLVPTSTSKGEKILTVQRPIPPLHTLPFALASLSEVRHVDVYYVPIDIQASIGQMQLDHLRVDVVADQAVGAEAVEEAEPAFAGQKARDDLGEEHAQLRIVLAKGVKVNGVVDTPFLKQLVAHFLPFTPADLEGTRGRTALLPS